MCEADVEGLLAETASFVLVNHWYWALWAVNQARDEGCGSFPFLSYAAARLQEFDAKCGSA